MHWAAGKDWFLLKTISVEDMQVSIVCLIVLSSLWIVCKDCKLWTHFVTLAMICGACRCELSSIVRVQTAWKGGQVLWLLSILTCSLSHNLQQCNYVHGVLLHASDKCWTSTSLSFLRMQRDDIVRVWWIYGVPLDNRVLCYWSWKFPG